MLHGRLVSLWEGSSERRKGARVEKEGKEQFFVCICNTAGNHFFDSSTIGHNVAE